MNVSAGSRLDAAGTGNVVSRAARRSFLLVVAPGVASLLLMVCSWTLTRSRATVFVILAVLLLLFAIQLTALLRLHQRVSKAVGIAFSAALLFFAVFGVAYAVYADFAHQEGVFTTDKVGEAFFLATTLGTGTGFAPDVSSAEGLLIIAHLQLVVLALGVALTAASALGRMAARREWGGRVVTEAGAPTASGSGTAPTGARTEAGPGDTGTG